MQYPHWLIVVGAGLVVIGFIGFVFRRNNAALISHNAEQTSPNDNDEANRARPRGNGPCAPTPSERLRAARASVSAAAGLKAKE
jgi:hypothetical protein